MHGRATCNPLSVLTARTLAAGAGHDLAQRRGLVGVDVGVQTIETGGLSRHSELLGVGGLPRGLSAGG